MKVNIYIESNIKGVRSKHGIGMYLLESEIQGQIYTKNGLITGTDCTRNEMELTCLIEALKRMVTSVEIRIFTHNESIYGIMSNLWHIQWSKNNWVNSRGNLVKNYELWQQITELLSLQLWTVTMEQHSFEQWMKNEISKEEN